MDDADSNGLPPPKFAEVDSVPLIPLLARLNDPTPRDARLQSRTCFRMAHRCIAWARDAKDERRFKLARRRVELARLFWRAARLWRAKASGRAVTRAYNS
jgi:hypothetical protein